MPSIKVTIRDLTTDKTTEVQLPDDAPMSKLLPALAQRLGITEQSGAGVQYKLHYKAPNPPDPFDLKEEDTLGGRGVKDGSLLGFSHKFIAGC